MKKQLLFLLLFVVAGITAFAQNLIDVQQYTLKNGLTVFLNEDHSKNEVFGMIVVKAGSKNDPKDATGMAHYQEHMLFKGTEELGTTDWSKEKPHIDNIFALYDKLGQTNDAQERLAIQKQINDESLKANEFAIPNELDKVIKSMGGTNLNANTSEDRTVYFNTFPSNQINRWLDLYSHRFISPVFRGFQSELEVVYEEQNMYSDMFQTQLREEYNRNFFKKHPYGQQTVIGTIDHLKNPSLTKMYEFFKTYYVANNMALVLVGDFNSKEILPLIEEKFGQLPSGKIPQMETYTEVPFIGRELVEVNLSPIKIGMLGFRTPQNGHPDEIAMDILSRILSNGNQTGLFDQLNLQNKIMEAFFMNMSYNDYGAACIFFIPKLVGQSLDDAEKIVLDQMKKLKSGEFEDWMVDAIKKEMYVSYKTQLESFDNKAQLIGENFGKNKSLDDLNSYIDKLNKITKADIIAVANKYFGDNYLAFHSKMGRKEIEKIQKPDYKPVVSNTQAQSKYAKHFESIPTSPLNIKPINFNDDVKVNTLAKGHKLYSVKNPVNDIFSLTFQFGVGYEEIPMLKYSADAMNTSGTETITMDKLKEEFSKIGCSYSISASNSYVDVSIQGIEKNIEPAINLICKLIKNPKLDQSKIDLLISNEKTERKMERSELENVASALFDYVKYNNRSSYIDRLSLKEIKKLKAKQLTDAFSAATQFETEYHFTGNTPKEEVINLINKYYGPSENVKPSKSPISKEVVKYNENIIYLVDKPKSAQSKIYFLANSNNFTIEKEPFIDAFNLYFGGDFSGLVLQEIREYRSMAYNAGAYYSTPIRNGEKCNFFGMLGTQTDKTIDAITIFDSLVRHMPQKSNRMDMIKNYLTNSLASNQPSFRYLSQYINGCKLKGYSSDPSTLLLPAYTNMSFEDINNFYKENIQTKPMVIAIAGDISRINEAELSKFGKIIKVKEKNLFR